MLAADQLPRIVAHRGASADESENTKAAFELALAHHADGVECDIRMTSDRHLVCTHDRRVDRLTDSTGSLSSLTLEQAQALDWAAGPGVPDHIRGVRRGELVTVGAMLDLLADSQRATPLLTLIESKHPSRFRGMVEQVLAADLIERGLAEGPADGLEVNVMSFWHAALSRMRRLAPRVPLVYLIEQGSPSISFDGSLPAGVTTVGLDREYLNSPKVIRAHQRRGHTVYVWTVDEFEDVERCVELGVDVIISNRPRAVREFLTGDAH